MAKKCNPKKLKRAANARYAAMIRAKQEEKRKLKKAQEAYEKRMAAKAMRVTLLPEKRHGQVVAAP